MKITTNQSESNYTEVIFDNEKSSKIKLCVNHDSGIIWVSRVRDEEIHSQPYSKDFLQQSFERLAQDK